MLQFYGTGSTNRPKLVVTYATKLYPTNAITRVTSLIHTFDRLGGILTLTAGMGGVLAENDIPSSIVTPSAKQDEGSASR